MTERVDADLIVAARAGDRVALELLLERYEPQIYRFGLRLCGDEDSARDVLQETLLAAFRHPPGFRGDTALSTWLYQIARSFCIKARRGVRPTTSLEDASAARRPDAGHSRARSAHCPLISARRSCFVMSRVSRPSMQRRSPRSMWAH